MATTTAPARRTRIDSLTEAERARFPEWVDKWVAIGLSTERLDLPRFNEAAKACYRFADLAEPRVIVPVSSPLVLALAAPIASAILSGQRLVTVRGAVDGAVDEAVREAVREAVA